MSRNTGSVASSDSSWLKLYAAVAVLPLALAACGGGGGGGGGSPAPAPTPTPAPAPTPTPTPPAPAPTPTASITITPSATTTTPGGAAITLTAAVTGSTDSPTWSLSGVGTLSATSGTTITYTPPATADANSTAIVSAALTGATTQTVSLTVTVPAVAGLNWTNVTAPAAGDLTAVDYDATPGRYVAVSSTGSGLSSTDGTTWTATTPLTSRVATDHLTGYAIAHLGATYVAAGAISSAPYTTSGGVIATSTDGTTWTSAALPGSVPIHGLIAGPHLIGLGETGHIYSSSNGSTWTSVTTLSAAPGAPAIGTFNAGAYGHSMYVAVGDNGYIASSANGSLWGSSPTITAGSGSTAHFVNMHGLAWTGSQFVAVGDDGAIVLSADGTSWGRPGVPFEASALTGTLRSVSVSSTGLIVVVGDNGIETSPDGITWTARNDSGVAALFGTTFGNGKFVAVGTSNAIKTSVSTLP